MSDDLTEFDVKRIKDLFKPVNNKEKVEQMENLLDGLNVEKIDPYTDSDGDHVVNIIERSITKEELVKGRDESGEIFVTKDVNIDHISQITLYKCICGEGFASEEDAKDHLMKEAKARKRGRAFF